MITHDLAKTGQQISTKTEKKGTDILTTRMVATELAVAEQTICSWLKSGKLIGFKVGHSWRIMRSNLKKITEYEPEVDVLTVKEVAEIMKVRRETVFNWIKKGHLEAFKRGHDWRIIKSSLYDKIAGDNQLQKETQTGE